MNKGDLVIRWAAAVAVMVVTGIAAVISYNHAHELVQQHGESGWTAAALPITVDGLIATCSLVLLDCARRDRTPPWHAWVLLGAGVVATVGANIAHGLAHGWVGAVVAGWPALVAVGSFELLIRLVRGGKDQSDNRTLIAEETEPVPAEEPASAEWEWWPLPSITVERGDHPPADVDPAIEEPDVPEIEAGVPDGPEAYPEIARPFVEELQQGRLPTYRVIKRRLGVGQDRAKEVRDQLAVLASR